MGENRGNGGKWGGVGENWGKWGINGRKRGEIAEIRGRWGKMGENRGKRGLNGEEEGNTGEMGDKWGKIGENGGMQHCTQRTNKKMMGELGGTGRSEGRMGSQFPLVFPRPISPVFLQDKCPPHRGHIQQLLIATATEKREKWEPTATHRTIRGPTSLRYLSACGTPHMTAVRLYLRGCNELRLQCSPTANPLPEGGHGAHTGRALLPVPGPPRAREVPV